MKHFLLLSALSEVEWRRGDSGVTAKAERVLVFFSGGNLSLTSARSPNCAQSPEISWWDVKFMKFLVLSFQTSGTKLHKLSFRFLNCQAPLKSPSLYGATCEICKVHSGTPCKLHHEGCIIQEHSIIFPLVTYKGFISRWFPCSYSAAFFLIRCKIIEMSTSVLRRQTFLGKKLKLNYQQTPPDFCTTCFQVPSGFRCCCNTSSGVWE